MKSCKINDSVNACTIMKNMTTLDMVLWLQRILFLTKRWAEDNSQIRFHKENCERPNISTMLLNHHSYE